MSVLFKAPMWALREVQIITQINNNKNGFQQQEEYLNGRWIFLQNTPPTHEVATLLLCPSTTHTNYVRSLLLIIPYGYWFLIGWSWSTICQITNMFGNILWQKNVTWQTIYLTSDIYDTNSSKWLLTKQMPLLSVLAWGMQIYIARITAWSILHLISNQVNILPIWYPILK